MGASEIDLSDYDDNGQKKEPQSTPHKLKEFQQQTTQNLKPISSGGQQEHQRQEEGREPLGDRLMGLAFKSAGLGFILLIVGTVVGKPAINLVGMALMTPILLPFLIAFLATIACAVAAPLHLLPKFKGRDVLISIVVGVIVIFVVAVIITGFGDESGGPWYRGVPTGK